MARTHEITAIRSSGITVQRIALPLLILSLVICAFTFVWNESLVPIFTHNAQTIYKTEIKNKQQQSLLGTHDIWIRGDNSFINVEHFDARANTLENVTVFLLNRDFSLRGLMEIPKARWIERWLENRRRNGVERIGGRDNHAEASKHITRRFLKHRRISTLLARDVEEFTFFDFQKQIADMKSKGIDATAYEVDLQTKLGISIYFTV